MLRSKRLLFEAIWRDADRVLLIISGALAEIGGRGPANSRATGNNPGIFAIATDKIGDSRAIRMAW